MKIILITLPVGDFYLNFQRGNHQIFNDLFKSYIYAKNIKGIEIIELPRYIIDNYNNKALLNEILKLKPDVVGLSSYLWNISRNLSIAKELKQHNIVTILGGPEVTKDNDFIFNNSIYFDYLIEGEGEYKLLYLLEQLKNKSNKKYELKNNILNLQTEFFMLYDKIIENYIDITDDYKNDGLFYFETERGCPFNCSYCAYSKFKNKILTIKKENFKKYLNKIFLKNGIKEI